MKQSFIVYTDNIEYLEELSDEQVGQLYRAQICYSRGEDYEITDPMVRLAFKLVKGQMDRDNAKYQSKVANLKTNKTSNKSTSNMVSNRNQSEISVNSDRNQTEISVNSDRNQAEISGDNVTDTVTVTDTVNANNLNARVRARFKDFVETCEHLNNKPMSLARQQMIASRLLSVADTEEEQIKLLDDAIKNGWNNVYPARAKPKKETKADVLRILEAAEG